MTSIRRIHAFGPVILALAMAGCTSTPAPTVGRASPQAISELGQTEFAQPSLHGDLLLPSDIISVTVFREPDLSVTNLAVGSDGFVSLPLIGPVKAAGMTPTDFAAEVTSRLKHGLLVSPKVSVNVDQYTSHVVTVEGGVEQPGVYAFGQGSRLSSAIALAHGTTNVAKLSQVAIFRYDAQGTSVAKFDYYAIQRGTMIDPLLKPGDRVVVGISGPAQAWQDLLKALPVFAIFTRF